MSLFETGIRPAIDDFLLEKAKERRDYGEYWSASSAGYCMRKNIMERMKIPYTKEDARKQRVFEAGHIFHEWIQRITKNAGLSVAQEERLQDETLKVRGHFDDLILSENIVEVYEDDGEGNGSIVESMDRHLTLYDYKTQNSRAFSYQKDRPMSHYHRMQVGTYMYMLRQKNLPGLITENLDEARILKISKDDLRMTEQQLLWSTELEKEVTAYWETLNRHWNEGTVPDCTCADQEGSFMANEKYNPFFYDGEPCSLKWMNMHKE